MAIGGIGSYGSNYYNYQSTISQIRLQQALAKNTRYQQSVQAVDKVDTVKDSFKSNSMDFLRTYSGAMSDVMESANALRDVNSSGVMRDLAVSSSDSSVAEVTERYPARTEKEITVDVAQLAAAQQSVSEGVRGSATASEDMNFTINGKGGSVDIQVSAQKEDGTYKSNREMLREAATQINKSDANVIAKTVEKDGITTLELTGRDTGTSNAFTITGETGAAKGVENASIEAANAEYTVTTGNVSQTKTSQSNNITLDSGRIGATLKDTGSTTVSAQADSEKIASAVSDLIHNYNNAVSFLKDNISHGYGVSNQVTNMERTLASGKVMDKLGISKNKDGTLSVDKEVLKKSLQEDPELTKELISGSYGLAQTAFNRAGSAMRANSASLVSSDLQEYDQRAITDPINFMNMYSRTGAYNMSNYTSLGLMMNYLV